MTMNSKQVSSKASFSVRHPMWYIVILQVLLLVAVAAAGAYATINELDYTAPIWLSFIPIALVLMLYMTVKKRWGYYGFRSFSRIQRPFWMYYSPLLVALLIIGLQGFQELSLGRVIFFVCFTLLVGFV